MTGVIIELVVGVIVGIICIVIGFLNLKGNISMLHSYHIDNIQEENKLPFGKMVGKGMIIVGVSIIIFSSLGLPAYLLEDKTYSLIGIVIIIVGLVIGLGICFYAIKKYNKKII